MLLRVYILIMPSVALSSHPYKSTRVLVMSIFPRFRIQVMNTHEVLEPRKKSQCEVEYTIVNKFNVALKCKVTWLIFFKSSLAVIFLNNL